jgi:hypothetical protein
LENPFGFDPDGTDYGLIHPKPGIASAQLAALRDWLIAQAEIFQKG